MILRLEYSTVIVNSPIVSELMSPTMKEPAKLLEAILLVGTAHLRLEINIIEISAISMMVVSL
jgi:hypothetical protein